jgi:hypothetical protein
VSSPGRWPRRARQGRAPARRRTSHPVDRGNHRRCHLRPRPSSKTSRCTRSGRQAAARRAVCAPMDCPTSVTVHSDRVHRQPRRRHRRTARHVLRASSAVALTALVYHDDAVISCRADLSRADLGRPSHGRVGRCGGAGSGPADAAAAGQYRSKHR